MELNYKKHKDHDIRIKSAITAIKAILPLDLYLAHKKELLSVCLWKITEADGKHNTIHWSEGALAKSKTANKIGDIVPELIHEHVYERKELFDRLLSDKETVESVVENAIACVVTKAEHKVLTQSPASGWERYKNSRIKVYDLKNNKWLV